MDALSGLRLPYVPVPSTPPADMLGLEAGRRASRLLPRIIGPSGLDTMLQPNLFGNKIGRWNPNGNSATAPSVADGLTLPTALGTATTRNVAATSMATRARRLGYVSAATAGAFCGQYNSNGQFTIGALSGIGGFFYVCRFVVSDAAAVSGARMFVGLRNDTAAPTNVELNTRGNHIGIVQTSTSNNMQFYQSGTITPGYVDLGANFPVNTLSADLYELVLFAPPDTQVVYWQVTRLNTGHIAIGTATGLGSNHLPVATMFLGHAAFRTNNATALAAGIDIVQIYIETDN